jgi:CRP/FNR family cyclic AMP-dependent transcriptional regulator
LFAALDAEDIGRLAALAKTRAYPADAAVFLQGDAGNALYAVTRGQVRISIEAPSGAIRHLNLLGPGDLFGEIALLDGGPRTASATTTQPTSLAVIERRPFLALLREAPELSIRLLGLVCARVRWTSDLVEDAAFLPGPARLAKRLLGLKRLAGDDARIRISQALLASLSGLSRQVVSQQLTEWRRLGYVETGRGSITVLDEPALAAAVRNAR